jgi:hypothetical protein
LVDGENHLSQVSASVEEGVDERVVGDTERDGSAVVED